MTFLAAVAARYARAPQTPTARVASPKVTLGVRGAVAPQPSCHDASAAAGQGAGLRLSRHEMSKPEQRPLTEGRADLSSLSDL